METRFSFLVVLSALLSLLVVSCKKNNDPEPNRPPAPFTVTTKLAPGGIDVMLNWTKAKDPNGDAVSYAVVYKDTLAKNLTDTTYTIRNVGYSTTVTGSIIAKDVHGASTSATFTIISGADPYVLIPDKTFEGKLISMGVDDVYDGKVLVANAQKVTYLNFYRINSEATPVFNLQGVEAFTNLTFLNCVNNQLSRLDVSKNTKLTSLECSGNQFLPALDVSTNTELTALSCSGLPLLAQLNVSKNTKLKLLNCARCLLTQLDVSQNTALTSLDCGNNQLAKLDISQNLALTSLHCDYTQLSNLDISQNIALTELFCSSNKLATLNVSQNIALRQLACSANQLTTLDVARNKVLAGLTCDKNQLTALNVSQNRPLTYLNCSTNQLTSLDLRSNPVLSSMYCTTNKIQTICVVDPATVPGSWQKDASAVYQDCK